LNFIIAEFQIPHKEAKSSSGESYKNDFKRRKNRKLLQVPSAEKREVPSSVQKTLRHCRETTEENKTTTKESISVENSLYSVPTKSSAKERQSSGKVYQSTSLSRVPVSEVRGQVLQAYAQTEGVPRAETQNGSFPGTVHQQTEVSHL